MSVSKTIQQWDNNSSKERDSFLDRYMNKYCQSENKINSATNWKNYTHKKIPKVNSHTSTSPKAFKPDKIASEVIPLNIKNVPQKNGSGKKTPNREMQLSDRVAPIKPKTAVTKSVHRPMVMPPNPKKTNNIVIPTPTTTTTTSSKRLSNKRSEYTNKNPLKDSKYITSQTNSCKREKQEKQLNYDTTNNDTYDNKVVEIDTIQDLPQAENGYIDQHNNPNKFNYDIGIFFTSSIKIFSNDKKRCQSDSRGQRIRNNKADLPVIIFVS